jgi:hypothetical protein
VPDLLARVRRPSEGRSDLQRARADGQGPGPDRDRPGPPGLRVERCWTGPTPSPTGRS